MNRLNSIFDRVVDKKSRGIREDKLIKLLPTSCFEQDPSIIAQKYGLNYDLLCSSSSECNNKKKRRRKVRKKDMRVVSRGAFLSMFSFESSAFIHSICLNERNARRKEKQNKRMKQQHLMQSPPSVTKSRQRSSTAPNVMPRKYVMLERQLSDRSSSSSASEVSNISANNPTSPTHRRKKSRHDMYVLQNSDNSEANMSSISYQDEAELVGSFLGKNNDEHLSSYNLGYLTSPTAVSSQNDFSVDESLQFSLNESDRKCSTLFSIVESILNVILSPLVHKRGRSLEISNDVSFNSYPPMESITRKRSDSYGPTPDEVILNSHNIANYLKSANNTTGINGDLFIDLDVKRRHRRSPSFCLLEDESSLSSKKFFEVDTDSWNECV